MKSFSDDSTVVMRQAMQLRFVKDPKERASAQQVADLLMDALLNMTDQGGASEEQQLPVTAAKQQQQPGDEEEGSGDNIMETKG